MTVWAVKIPVSQVLGSFFECRRSPHNGHSSPSDFSAKYDSFVPQELPVVISISLLTGAPLIDPDHVTTLPAVIESSERTYASCY